MIQENCYVAHFVKFFSLFLGQAEAQAAAPVEKPQPAPPSPIRSILEQVPQNVVQRQESPIPSGSDDMGACALPIRSLLPPRFETRKVR